MILKTGQEAPDFVLPSHLDQPVRLSDYRGQEKCSPGLLPDGLDTHMNQSNPGLRG